MVWVLDSKQDCLNYMRAHPYTKMKHRNFKDDEYIYMNPADGLIYDQTGEVFDDHNGDVDWFRALKDESWQTGWYIFCEIGIRTALIRYMSSDPKDDGRRNRMGCSESWYNLYYAFAQTFTLKDLEKMSEQEIWNILKIAGNIQEALY